MLKFVIELSDPTNKHTSALILYSLPIPSPIFGLTHLIINYVRTRDHPMAPRRRPHPNPVPGLLALLPRIPDLRAGAAAQHNPSELCVRD